MEIDQYFTEKEQQLLEQLDINKYRIELKLNEIPNKNIRYNSAVIDVEHNENGEFVCIGVLFPVSNTVYCFTDVDMVCSIDFTSFKIVGHNVVGDVELLNQWRVK